MRRLRPKPKIVTIYSAICLPQCWDTVTKYHLKNRGVGNRAIIYRRLRYRRLRYRIPHRLKNRGTPKPYHLLRFSKALPCRALIFLDEAFLYGVASGFFEAESLWRTFFQEFMDDGRSTHARYDRLMRRKQQQFFPLTRDAQKVLVWMRASPDAHGVSNVCR